MKILNQKTIYALDFDGVICDSAIETAVSGWKVAKEIWSDFNEPLPSQHIIDQFRLVRPVLEFGYEAILIMKLLHDGNTVDEIIRDYSQKLSALVKDNNLDAEDLKQQFGESRDQWIQNDLASWIEMNPLFEGIATKLQQLINSQDEKDESDINCYIVTTKQERFVQLILQANNINLSDENIYGLDRKQSKEEILEGLQKTHPQETLHFVEDRLPALFNVKNNSKLQSIQLSLADWGYNTAQDIAAAKENDIQVIEIDKFLVSHPP